MKTKAQKTQKVEEGGKMMDGKNTIVFVDFTGTRVNDMNVFRGILHGLGTKMEVLKKRLFRVILKNKGFDFDPGTLRGQLGVVHSDKQLEELAGPVYKFAKQSKTFKILGGLNLHEKKFVSGAEVEAIGALPSREILLARVVGTIAAPIKAFLYILNEKSKQQT